jgi:hypothetical protein
MKILRHIESIKNTFSTVYSEPSLRNKTLEIYLKTSVDSLPEGIQNSEYGYDFPGSLFFYFVDI